MRTEDIVSLPCLFFWTLRPITAKPTFTFNYSAPLGWTWNTAALAVGGQSLSEQLAQSRINTDIESAVIDAVSSYGFSTSGVVVRNAVRPDNIVVSPPGTCSKAYGQENGAVTKKCLAGNVALSAASLYSKESSIDVTSPVALAKSNWENIATKVFASLTTKAGVKFYGPITVTA
ncbi:hypothetical protein PRIPAC_82637 [Pristionchus pacificus]|uniref:Uncharacterized protein n=1 Tax=Pristionchus pacificus TaxID=54126 RepID=A0A2A6CQ79_PRIPA|nr:hypothetical protein PRIPAC_82637 [Pristionchus pacificus]|eukprot:PDM80203.1 hypothetical protein PRIPAC_32782 [Pristionchus pacificus]